MRLGKWAVRLGVTLLAAPVIAFAVVAYWAQRADYGWRPDLAAPAFVGEHPRVLFDQGHHNSSTIDLWGRYWAFGRLLAADGYDLRKGAGAFVPASLEGAQVLVVVNASGAPKPQFFGINLPVATSRERSAPAFSTDEIRLVRGWVEQGGALLLVADHAPFGSASAALAAAFGVEMHAGFTEVPGELSDPLLFSRENGRLGDHPILTGSGPQGAIGRVMTFTGQSLDGPPGAAVLLRLPPTAVEYVPNGEAGRLAERPAGRAQGLALAVGRGRVVVLGEAAMLTAQVDGGRPFGMNTPRNDNRQLVLNVLHWLSGKL